MINLFLNTVLVFQLDNSKLFTLECYKEKAPERLVADKPKYIYVFGQIVYLESNENTCNNKYVREQQQEQEE